MEKENPREQILRSALELFSEDPYNEVTLDEIARRAGVSKGGLFHYFPSKYDLAKEALFYGVEQLTERMIGTIQSLSSPEEKLKGFIGYCFDMVLENPKFSRFFLEVYEKSLERKNNFEEWKNFSFKYLSFFEEVFDELNIPRPRVKGLLLGAILDGLALYLPVISRLEMSSEIADLDTIKREIYEIFVGKR